MLNFHFHDGWIARCCCYSLLMFCMISLMLFYMFVRCERERETRFSASKLCLCLYRKIQTLSQPAYQHYSRIYALDSEWKEVSLSRYWEVRCAMQSQQQQVCCTGEVIPEVFVCTCWTFFLRGTKEMKTWKSLMVAWFRWLKWFLDLSRFCNSSCQFSWDSSLSIIISRRFHIPQW